MDFSIKGTISRAWLVVGASTVLMAGFYGAEVCFSIFLKPLLIEFGWTRAAVSGGMAILQGTAGLVGVVMGTLTDRYGSRMLIAAGAIIGGLGYVLMSQVGSLWQLYLYYGVMVGIAIASCWTPVNATVSQRFVEKRLLALGITTSGITIGSMLLPPIMAYYVASHGWRPAYIVLSLTVWFTAIPAVALLGRNPPQSEEASGRGRDSGTNASSEVREPALSKEWAVAEASKTAAFWMLIITGFVTAAGYYFLITHIVAYATDMGIATSSAALILTFMGGANILGKLLIWSIASKIGYRFTLVVLFVMQGFALFLLMRASSVWMFFALGSIFGFGLGGTSPIRTATIPDFFGMSSVGAIIGLVSVAWAIGGMVGPVLAGYVFDLSQSYDMAFSAGGLLMIIGIVASYFLKAPEE